MMTTLYTVAIIVQFIGLVVIAYEYREMEKIYADFSTKAQRGPHDQKTQPAPVVTLKKGVR